MKLSLWRVTGKTQDGRSLKFNVEAKNIHAALQIAGQTYLNLTIFSINFSTTLDAPSEADDTLSFLQKRNL